MCCRDRLWGRGVAAFTAFLRTRLEWSFTSNLISISHHWGGNRPHNLAELQCPCGPKGMLLVWLQMGQSWTLSGSRNADSRVEILIENWAIKLACLNVMKWLRVFEMFIGCYLCQAGEKRRCRLFNGWQKTRKYKVIQVEHVQVGKHPTTVSNWIFYHCETHWPICFLEWFQTWYSDRKVVWGLLFAAI